MKRAMGLLLAAMTLVGAGPGKVDMTARTIADIERVVTVFKDGVGYDPPPLLGSVTGRYGQY